MPLNYSKRLLMIVSLLSMASASCLGQGAGVQKDEQSSAATFRTTDGVACRVEVVAHNLQVPWSIAFLPDGRVLVTERPGRLRMISKGVLLEQPIADFREIVSGGEGGLMGLALHPDFARNHFLYLSYTTRANGNTINRVVQYKFEGDRLAEPATIIDNLPGASIHDGCRIKFGPDGKLYVTTGDAAQRSIAQDMNSMGGKILRLNDDGSIPADNPFPKSPVYSLGNRNPQGIDWHPQTRVLYETEHGPSGFDAPGGGDEVNIIDPGKNYGWPVIHHRETREGMVSPLLEYTPAEAPADATFYRGSKFPKFRNNFFFANLRGSKLIRVILDGSDPRTVRSTEVLLDHTYGRLREIIEGPDGFLYFTTSNRDGRGRPDPADDRILRIVPAN